MKIFESVILSVSVVSAVAWTIIGSKDGFNQSNAMIVARSINITSTIDGKVENNQLPVGTPLKRNDLMVKIRNNRIDNSLATQLKTRLTFLKSEIANTRREQAGLHTLLKGFEKRSTAYGAWLLNDLNLQREVKLREFVVAQKQKKLMAAEVRQTRELVRRKQISRVILQKVLTKAEIADNKVKVSKAQLTRNELMLKSVKNDGMFFEGGDTSYWRKTIDSLKLRIFNNDNKIAQLEAQLVQYSEREQVELKRLSTDFVEEHRSPFKGFVNAVYVTKGARVKSGTTLLQILDCTNPVIIIPIPELRFNDFFVGQKVTINPVGSKQMLSGTIKYISSGALISNDRTIALQQKMTAQGSRAVVTFDRHQSDKAALNSCVTARRANVTIHMKSLYDTISKFVKSYLGDGSLKSARRAL